uniref:(northern house mosquito) hypothetical protein n=1 Tax=Culex pipiens TaxID=7175 RepID=A0A8D8ABR0_CULPI
MRFVVVVVVQKWGTTRNSVTKYFFSLPSFPLSKRMKFDATGGIIIQHIKFMMRGGRRSSKKAENVGHINNSCNFVGAWVPLVCYGLWSSNFLANFAALCLATCWQGCN